MSNSVKKKNINLRLTRLQLKNQKKNVLQDSRNSTKNLDRSACERTKVSNMKETTSRMKETTSRMKEATSKVTSISKKLELESSPTQLEILSVKEDKGQVLIEFRSRSCAAPSSAEIDGEPHNNQTKQDGFTEVKVEDEIEFGATSISVQSIPAIYNDVEGGSTTIKVEDEMDIKIEDEIEFCALSSTSQSIVGTDDEENSNQTIQDEFTELEDQMEFSDKVEIDASNTAEIKVVAKSSKNQYEFSCEICSKKFTTKGNLGRHRLRHGKPNFNCTVCGVAKFNQSELDEHLWRHDTNRIYFTCDICSKKFSLKRSLTKHQQRHGKRKFQCTVCGLATFHQWDLNIHMRTHDANRIYFACDICSKKFSKKTDLNFHRLRHGKPNFHCTVCGASKFTKRDMNSHVKIHDTANPTYFTCDICSEKFSTEVTLRAHRKRHGEPKFHCAVCGVARFSQYELDRHMGIHDTNRIYFKCDLCSKKFSRKTSMSDHRLRHGKPNFHCTVCGASKFTKRDMNSHVKIHDTANPIYFPCDICSKKFSTKSYLTAHRKRHDKPRFHCTACDLSTFSKFALDRHKKKVHNTK